MSGYNETSGGVQARGVCAAEGARVAEANQTTQAPGLVKGVRAAEWAVRIAYLAVFAINMLCIVQFCLMPDDFAPAYELSGAAGSVAVQGIGVAFLMWNVTYPLVIWKPSRNVVLAGVVLVQQLVGLVGESLILAGIPVGHDVLCANIVRFIVFDGAGLVVMSTAFTVFVVMRRRAA